MASDQHTYRIHACLLFIRGYVHHLFCFFVTFILIAATLDIVNFCWAWSNLCVYSISVFLKLLYGDCVAVKNDLS